MRAFAIALCCLLATNNYYGTNVTAGKATNRHLSLPPTVNDNLPFAGLDLHRKQQAVVIPPSVLTGKEEEDTTIVKEAPSDLSPSGASNSVVEADLLIRHEDLEQHQNVDVDIHKEKDEDLLPVVRHDKVRLLRLGTSLHDNTSAKMIADATYSKDSATPAAVEDGATREDATLVKASTTHPRQKRHLRLRRDHTETPAHRDLPVMSMSTQLTPIKQFIFDDHFSTVDFETASKVAEITSKIFIASNGRINISMSEAMGAFVMEEELEPAFWHGHLDRWTKCIAIIRVLDKVHFSYDLEGEFGHLVCGDSNSPTLSPINSDSDSSTLGPSNSPSLASTTIKQFYIGAIILLNKSTRMLLEHHERSLQSTSSDCEAVLEATFKQLFANALTKGTDVTDVAVASFSQDSSGDLTVEFTATADVGCASAKCETNSIAEVNQVIEDALNSVAFDAALVANLEGKDCPELEGVTLVSVDATTCFEPGFCDLSDPTTCGVGEICLLQTGTCPLSTCVGAPTLSPSIGPSNSPSLSPTTPYPTSGPSDSGNPSAVPSISPSTTSVPSISSAPTECGDSCDGNNACPIPLPADVTIECGSCIEYQSCDFLGGASGSATVGKQSCVGFQSCIQAGADSGSATIGEGSCDGKQSCQSAGGNGNAAIGEGSCSGSGSCYLTGNSGGSATIGNGSCDGVQSCSLSGYNGGSATIGNDSCIGYRSCRYSGGNVGGSATIGNDSCNGEKSCYQAGKGDVLAGAGGNVTIGNGSCNAFKACAGKGYGAGTEPSAEILSGKCNNPCECCVPGGGVICDCDTKCVIVNDTAVPPLYANCTA